VNDLAGLQSQIGRYRVQSLLGCGGMGRIVRGFDPVLSRDVALKLVEAQSIDPADCEELRFMFHREARAIAQLKHPNIIEVFDYSGPDAELPYIACELVEADTLRDILDARGVALPPAVATALAYELALALEHAHNHGIVHRDVKPDNVFWSPSGRVILADFGVAKALTGKTAIFGGTLTHGATNLYGSPAYMAPEQVRGDAIDERVDIHALGCLLFEALCGQPPYDGMSVAAIIDAVGRGERRALPADVAATSLKRLVDQMLEPDPKDRPGSARAVSERLRNVLDDLDIHDPRRALVDLGRGVGQTTESNEEKSANVDDRITADRVNPLSPGASKVLVMGLMTATVLIGLVVGRYRVHFTKEAQIPTRVVLYFPGSCELFIDGQSLGPAREPFRTEVISGRHVIEARDYDSGRMLSKEVFVLPGNEAQFDIAR
jgi:serine/threonine protein kinase